MVGGKLKKLSNAADGLVFRHLAWFHTRTGVWIGEWAGRVPAPLVPSWAGPDARARALNRWLHATQTRITPAGCADTYHAVDQVWSLDAWDDCGPGEAVCLDVTLFAWPVGDHRWHVWDDTDRRLLWPEVKLNIQITSARIGANGSGSRPVMSSRDKLVIDITNTPAAAFHGQLFGQLRRDDNGRVVLQPGGHGEEQAALARRATTALLDAGCLPPDIQGEGGRLCLTK